MHLVFACGTLKKGFPLHEVGLGGSRCLGALRTVERYPLVVAGPWFAPMLLYEPGLGRQVIGELYQVDDHRLSLLDKLESIGKPGNDRFTIMVESTAQPVIRSAYAYFKSRDLAVPLHTGFLADYQDRRFIPPDQRVDADGLSPQSRTGNKPSPPGSQVETSMVHGCVSAE
jgi:gamma-glutamylaminecyclotransferase